MLSKLKKVGVGAVLFAPYLVLAQGSQLTGAADTAKEVINIVTQIVVALAFIYFLWGLMQYLIGDAEKKAESKSAMIYGLLIMFVMFSIWGLIGVLRDTFNLTDDDAIDVNIPEVNGI